MQIIYRVVLLVGFHETKFDFIDPGAACKFADAAKGNLSGANGDVRIYIQLLTKEEIEAGKDEQPE